MVAMNTWPTDGADGSVATEAKWRKMARLWAPNGVTPSGGRLAPSLAYPNLTVQDGSAWVDGHFAELLGAQVLAVTANGLVVVRFDPAANTAELLYRAGVTVPAQNPVGVWELPIAQIVGSTLVDLRQTDVLMPTIEGNWGSGRIASDLSMPGPTGAPIQWVWTVHGTSMAGLDPVRGQLTLKEAGTYLITATLIFTGPMLWGQLFMEHLRASTSIAVRNAPGTASAGFGTVTAAFAFSVAPGDTIEIRANAQQNCLLSNQSAVVAQLLGRP